ncbi:hypothetical protein [Ferruginibacter sp.]
MPLLETIFEVADIVIDKIPIAGSMKRKLDDKYTSRELSAKEVADDKWIKRNADYLNKVFKKRMKKRPYSKEKLKEWISINPESFVIFVRRKTISWPINGEKIVSTVKIQPLNTDSILPGNGNFDPFIIKGIDMTNDFKTAKAIWIGDLSSSNNEMPYLFKIVKEKVGDLKIPVYFRTADDRLRKIFFERYSAKILVPVATAADGDTILVIS